LEKNQVKIIKVSEMGKYFGILRIICYVGKRTVILNLNIKYITLFFDRYYIKMIKIVMNKNIQNVFISAYFCAIVSVWRTMQ